MWPGGAILQPCQAFSAMAIDPFANRARAGAYGFANGFRRLPACNQFHDPLSTARRQPGILMHVHPVLRDC